MTYLLLGNDVLIVAEKDILPQLKICIFTHKIPENFSSEQFRMYKYYF
jgi:hypothetical protein